MAFTLSSSKTIDGVTGSYEVTGSGNLDDLVTACSGIGMSRSNNVITFNPGSNRILAVSGALADERTGIRAVNVRGNGHICWAYAASSSVKLGHKTDNSYDGSVNITYEGGALTLGGDNYSVAQGKCLIGKGAFAGVSGSISTNHSLRSDMDISNRDATTPQTISFDNWLFFMTPTGGSYGHMWQGRYSGVDRFVTTNRTYFDFSDGRLMQALFNTSAVSSFGTNIGFLWFTEPDATDAAADLRVEKPTYPVVTHFGNPANLARWANKTINIIDPYSRYLKQDPRAYDSLTSSWAGPSTKLGIIKLWRSLNINYLDQLGEQINNAKLVSVKSGVASIDSLGFNGTISKEYLQAVKPHNTSYNSDGAGYVDESAYDFYVVAYGYAAQKTSVNLGIAYMGTDGVIWSPVSVKSPLVTTTYASVVTAPFSFVTTGNGTLTLSSGATTAQIAEYLFKQAYDNADLAYWRGLSHTPASGTQAISIGSISLTLNSVLTGADLRTTGNITVGTSGMPTAQVSGSVITISSINTATLNASTRIDGLLTTGTISTSGKLGFGSGTTINASGDLTISGTELAGSLIINTSEARKLTLSNCTGSLSAISITGGGSLQVLFTNGTKSTVLPASLPASVTSAVVVIIQSDAAFDLLTIVDFENSGETEAFSQNSATHTRYVPPGKSLRMAYGALAKVTAYQSDASVAESKVVTLNMLDDTNVTASTDIESAKAMISWDTLDTTTNRLKMRVGAGSIESVAGQNVLAYMAWQHQCLRLIARTANSKHLTTTSQGIAITTAITVDGKSTNQDIDPCKILTYITAPAGHIITPKSEGGAGEPPRGFSVQVTEVPLVQARVEDEQLVRIATLAKDEIEASTVIAKASAIQSMQVDITAVKAKTDNLPDSPAAVGSAMGLTSAYDSVNSNIAAIKAKTDTITAPLTASDIKTALEASGSKLDRALKAAQAAEDQGL